MKSWMPRGRRRWRRRSLLSPVWIGWIGAIALPVLLLSLLLMVGQPAQADFGTDSRIAQLEAQVRSLATQVGRLESAIARSGSPPQRSIPNPTAPNLPIPTDPMFDRLATLVIEIKDDLHDLENRVARLEGDRR